MLSLNAKHNAWITPTGLADGFGHPSCPT